MRLIECDGNAHQCPLLMVGPEVRTLRGLFSTGVIDPQVSLEVWRSKINDLPSAHRCASSCVQQASRRSFAACSPLEPRAGLPSVPMSKIVYFLGHGFSPEAAPKYPRRKTGECPPARLLLPGGLGTPPKSWPRIYLCRSNPNRCISLFFSS